MPITTTKLSKNKTSRQCSKHRRLVTLSLQEQHPLLGTFLCIAMDRGSFRKTGAGLNPRQDHVLACDTSKTKNHSVQWHRLALQGKLAEPVGSVKHREKYRKNKQKNLERV